MAPVPEGDIALYFLTGSIPDISSADQEYFPVPQAGRLVEVRSIIHGALGTADPDLTVKVNGTSVGTITVTQSGSGAGDIDSLDLDTHVLVGDNIEIETDGASTNTVKVTLVVAIDRS